jgi:hypothetical protein
MGVCCAFPVWVPPSAAAWGTLCTRYFVGILGGFHTNYIICRNVENFKMMENEESFGMFQNVNMEIFKIN